MRDDVGDFRTDGHIKCSPIFSEKNCGAECDSAFFKGEDL